MADPTFYPHAATRVERRDTHISTVFLTGEWVYKLKKPVSFGFLDFTTLEARQRFCRQEVELNRRLSRGIYEGVVSICRDESGRFFLGIEAGEASGTVVEYAVKMRQLPDGASLQVLLRQGKVLPRDLRELGHLLARFYEQSERRPEMEAFADPRVIAVNMEENFEQMEPFVDDVVPLEEYAFIREASRAFFRYHSGLFERRIREKRICDGHGDLRAEHIYFLDSSQRGGGGSIQIIDCIEFNDRFRYGDAASDLAFLVMDLDRLGFPELGRALVAGYVEEAADPGVHTVLDFYAAYRAVVRMKVACLATLETRDSASSVALKADALNYMRLAYRYAHLFSRPTLWVFCGLPASGKSVLAEALAEALSLLLLQSDRLRKEEGPSAEGPRVVPYDTGDYRLERRHRVYAHLLALAQDELKNGRSVVLDASYSRRRWRDEVRRLAADIDVNVIFVQCICPEETLRERLRLRAAAGSVSDARLQHLPALMRDFDPLDELPPDAHVRANTIGDVTEVLYSVFEEAYALRRMQIARRLEPWD